MLDFPDAPPLPSLMSKDPDILKTVDETLFLMTKSSSQWFFEVNNDNKSTEYYYKSYKYPKDGYQQQRLKITAGKEVVRMKPSMTKKKKIN